MSIESVDHSALSLRFRLRASTAALHRATERVFALDRRFATRTGYRDLLAALHGFHAPIEAALRGLDWTGSAIDAERFCKTTWLAADLAALGLAEADIAALPRCRDLPAITSRAAGLGALYVLEGATLGGQLIVKELKDRLGVTCETGGRFFSSYGKQIGVRWRAFAATLDAFDGDPALVERAAADTFRAFGDWLPPPPGTPHD